MRAMTNGEKYRTAQERSEAFGTFCSAQSKCETCPLRFLVGRTMSHLPACAFAWLELGYDPHAEPCPFCGGKCSAELVTEGELGTREANTYHAVVCYGRNHDGCGYASRGFDTEAEAIEAHNRVARAVKGEAK